ncbi:hypothetical protein [Adhaeribacter radiodurans]|uniref:Transposase n=1 Tax=Adhaeribacter radiodurans TaxID=2745197 RepID=A0A7L7L780_9BACT|nr:hypothetical protein [Adhaeribacter radiodurans]QMU28209.1 hypothetical protein HUW48_09225 [Adhaeribacter radiodurans]
MAYAITTNRNPKAKGLFLKKLIPLKSGALPASGEMKLNPFGQIAYKEWLETPTVRPNVALDVFVIMPNHLHGILIIRKGELHSPLLPPPDLPLPVSDVPVMHDPPDITYATNSGE